MAFSYTRASRDVGFIQGSSLQVRWVNTWTVTEVTGAPAGKIRLSVVLSTSEFWVYRQGYDWNTGWDVYSTDSATCNGETITIRSKTRVNDGAYSYSTTIDVPNSWAGQNVTFDIGDYGATVPFTASPTYILSLDADGGSNISAERTASDVGLTGNLLSGSVIYSGDVLKITFSPSANYIIDTHTVNGTTFTSGNTHQVTGNTNVVATSLPAKSDIAATDANIGATSVIAITRYNSSYRHTITYRFGSLSGTIVTKSNQTSIGWTVPTSFYAQIPDAKTGVCTLTCETFDGDTSFGTTTCTLTVTAAEANCAPTVSGVVTDTNSDTSALTGDSSALVLYRSTAHCVITATSRNGATIRATSINGVTPTNGSIDISGSNLTSGTFTFSATDSRGYTTTITVTKDTVSYVSLTLNQVLHRPSPTSGEISASFNGNYYNGSFGDKNNTLKIQYRYRKAGTTSWLPLNSWITIDSSKYRLFGNSFYTQSDVALSDASGSSTGFDYTSSYIFEIRAIDGNGSVALTTITNTVTVQKGLPVFDWGENDFRFNVKPYYGTSELATLEDIPEPTDITKKAGILRDTASGDIVSIVPDATVPKLLGLTATINPVQNLRGFDRPWPGGGGVNQYNAEAIAQRTNNGITITVDNGTITFNGTATANAYFSVDNSGLPSGDYIFSFNNPVANSGVHVSFHNANNEYFGDAPADSVNKTLRLQNREPSTIIIYVTRGVTLTNFVVKPQLESGSIATAFEPYENLCPITGWTGVKVPRTGVNVWDEEWEVGNINTVGVAVDSTDRIRTKNYVSVIPGAEYYIKTPIGLNLRLYGRDKEFIGLQSSVSGNYTIPSGVFFVRFVTPGSSYVGGTTYNNDISVNYPATDHNYHAYSGTVLSVVFSTVAGTVYGGIWDVVNGVLTATRVGVDMGGLTWRLGSSRASLFYAAISGKRPGRANYTLSCYPVKEIAPSQLEDFESSGGVSNTEINIADPRFADAASFKAAMVGQVAVYELATPITYTLTPQEIGVIAEQVNNIWADTGPVDVTYAADLQTEQAGVKRALTSLADNIDDMQIVSGSDNNCFYTKFQDGTMVQWGKTILDIKSGLSQIGSSGIYSYYDTITLPQPFLDTTSYVLTGVVKYDTGHEVPCGTVPSSANQCLIRVYDFYARPASSTLYVLRWMAVGRWK